MNIKGSESPGQQPQKRHILLFLGVFWVRRKYFSV